jgi:peptidoglycan/LPS O-acetylase OafA/YrhL
MPGLAVCVLVCFFIIGPIGFSGDIKSYFQNKEYWKFLRNIFFISKLELIGIFEKNPYPNTLNGSLWTLPIEFKWYLVLAVLGFFNMINKKIIFSIIFFSIAYFIYINYFAYEQKTFKTFFYLGNFFLIGVLLFLTELNFLILFISLATSVFFLIFKFYYLALVIGLPPLIVYIGLKSFKYLNKINKIGDLSYGIYLFAFPIQQTIFYFGASKLNFLVSFLFHPNRGLRKYTCKIFIMDERSEAIVLWKTETERSSAPYAEAYSPRSAKTTVVLIFNASVARIARGRSVRH